MWSKRSCFRVTSVDVCIYFSLFITPQSILRRNNIFWRGRSLSNRGWFTVCGLLMRLDTKLSDNNSLQQPFCGRPPKWAQTRHNACTRHADAGDFGELTAKEDLLHNRTKSSGTERFVLNYGGNAPHSFDTNCICMTGNCFIACFRTWRQKASCLKLWRGYIYVCML